MSKYARVMLIAFVLIGTSVLFAHPAAAQEPGGGGMQRAFFEVDYFTYRASFRLSDGAEALLIRSSFKVNFLYQHHQPTLNHHYMTATLGFYFGKTVLGRSLIQNLSFEEISFYPKWEDSAGYSHDLFLDTPIVSISGNMIDGRMVSDSLLIDDDAISQYLPMFGGTLAITGLRLELIDGSTVFFEDAFYIELEKHSNEFYPRNATLTGTGVNYDVSNGYVNINTTGPSQTVLLIDLILGITMIGIAGLVTFLGFLHVRGRIVLPISRLTGAIRTTAHRRSKI